MVNPIKLKHKPNCPECGFGGTYMRSCTVANGNRLSDYRYELFCAHCRKMVTPAFLSPVHVIEYCNEIESLKQLRQEASNLVLLLDRNKEQLKEKKRLVKWNTTRLLNLRKEVREAKAKKKKRRGK